MWCRTSLLLVATLVLLSMLWVGRFVGRLNIVAILFRSVFVCISLVWLC